MKSRLDVARLVLHYFERDPPRQQLLDARQPRLDVVNHLDRIGAGLAPDFDGHRILAVVARRGALLLAAVLGITDVADADGDAIDAGDHQLVEELGVGEPAHGAQHQFAAALVHAAPGNLRVLPRHRVADIHDRNAVGGHAVGVDPDVHRPAPSAHHQRLAHAADGLDGVLDGPVGDLVQLPRRALSGQHDRHHRRRVRVEFLDQRRLGVARHQRDRARHGVAHVLRGHVDLPVQVERDGHHRQALHRSGADVVDAFHRGHRIFHAFGDGAFDFLG